MTKPSIFSFFSGAGFLDLGFETEGYDVCYVNEYHVPFLEAYKHSRQVMDIGGGKQGGLRTCQKRGFLEILKGNDFC